MIMQREMAERFQRWFQYEIDVHAKVVQSLESVPATRRDDPAFQKAVDVLAHIAAARGIWLVRLGIAEAPQGNLAPQQAEFGQVQQRLQSIHAAWAGYFARVSDVELARTVEYQSLDAGRFRNRVEDILTQLFGHSSYHRGQIAMLVKACGGQPAITDFIYWCREAVPAVTGD
jgi:uncharacterized damage-inducible protein DinB